MPLWYHSDGALILCPLHSALRLVELGYADRITISITDTPEDVLQNIITQNVSDVSNADTAVRACYPRKVNNSKSSPTIECDQCTYRGH